MKYLILCFAFLFFHTNINSQGCVAIRSNGGTCTMMPQHGEADHAVMSNWTLGVNNRYFKSYKHFVGKEEQKERIEAGTEVINHFASTEFSILRQLNNRWSLGLFVPVISNARSSMYEHYGNSSTKLDARRSTHSFGLGDARMATYYWLLNPSKSSRANVQIGLGFKLPTGDYRYQDYFYKNDSVKLLGPVDQSIQLGDGGTGITLEANSFYSFSKTISVYLNAFYLSNPREQNGVSTARGSASSATAIAYGSDVMSVPDQYMLRVGANYAYDKFSFSGGMRMECVPAEDLIGGSNGFRRPGYVISVEPVVAYKIKKTQFYISLPFAVERNRTQSVPDKIRTTKTGVYAQGDAAFSDYTINFGASFSLK
ncbi:MAG: hypothetical protein M3352_03145 [Bacteroidota bacterium]|nr:hypothetical protein [Bacteroidota bacterium]